MKTLEQEFPFLMDFPEPSFKSERELDLARGYQFAKILRYIIKNNCRLEHRQNSSSNHWESGTLREFLKYATGLPFRKDNNYCPFQDYLQFWRIKRTATPSELERIITIDDKEEY